MKQREVRGNHMHKIANINSANSGNSAKMSAAKAKHGTKVRKSRPKHQVGRTAKIPFPRIQVPEIPDNST